MITHSGGASIWCVHVYREALHVYSILTCEFRPCLSLCVCVSFHYRESWYHDTIMGSGGWKDKSDIDES